MSMFRKDDDEAYSEYLESDGSIFGKMDKQEFVHIRERAREIHSGFVSGMFERDERVWNEITKLREL